MSAYETLTLLVLVVTAIIAFVALVRTRRLEERHERLREKQEELTELQIQLLRREVEDQGRIEPTRLAPPPADVRLSLEGSGHHARFVVTNWGLGPARNVDFRIKTREGRSSPLVKGDYDERLPIHELLPGDRVTFIAALTFATGTTFDAALTWTNADNSTPSRDMQVSLT